MGRAERRLASAWADRMRALPTQATTPQSALPSNDASAPKSGTRRKLPVVGISDDATFDNAERPRTRGECATIEGPCPFVSCKYHLYFDVNGTDSEFLAAPRLEVWEMVDTCALDVADEDGVDLERIAISFGVTHERIRQIEATALEKLRKRPKTLAEYADGYGAPIKPRVFVREDNDDDECSE